MENTAVTENLGSEVLEEKLVQVNRVAKAVSYTHLTLPTTPYV